ncbi:MAG: hypothetical protein ACI8V2_001130 [Candidatus Latescibacterota bacterium]
MNKQHGAEGITQNEKYGMGMVLVLGVVIWGWHWATFAQPFWGTASEMVCAVGLGYMPIDPQPIYLWLGRLMGIFFAPDVGLRVLALLGGVVGVGSTMYMVHRLTRDTVQTILGGVMLVLFPVLMRQAVVQEAGAVLFGTLSLSLAVLLSGHERRYLISGILFGVAVGVHPSALLTLLGFAILLRKEDVEVLKTWAVGALAVVGVGWLWLFFLFRSSGVTGSWLAYMLGSVGDGYGALGPSALLSGLTRQTLIHTQLFGWGGFAFGVLGLVLIAFQNRERFLLLCGFCVPFLVYQLPRVTGGDDGLFLAIWAPVYVLGVGTAWREGSHYLAEGLQETIQTMLWVVAVVLVVIQVVCVKYTENTWEFALERRATYASKLQKMVDVGAQIQSQTQAEDLIVVIPDSARPGAFGVVASPWAVVWQSKRQVVWGEDTSSGWVFYTHPKNPGRTWQWMHQKTVVDDAFIGQSLRAGNRFLSFEPFPFLHSSQIKTWMSALPLSGFEGGPLFRLLPGWPQAEDPDGAVDAYQVVFDTYVARGYSADAAACLEGIIQYHPLDLETHRKLGDMYMKLGTFKRASEIYEKLLVLAPQDPEVVLNLSGAYYSQDNVAQAIAVCEVFLAERSIVPDILFNLGGYYQKAGRMDDAREIYQAYLTLGELGERLDEVKEILESLKQE